MTKDQVKIDYFAIFGLERSYFVDEDALNASYIKQQSENHPDRFFNSDDSHKAVSLQKTAELNHAYSVLNSDESRAKHLLSLSGICIDGEEEILQTPEILEEAFYLREKLLFAESIAEVSLLRNSSVKDICSYKEQFDKFYQEGNFAAASEAYKRMVYQKKLLKEINLKYRELEG